MHANPDSVRGVGAHKKLRLTFWGGIVMNHGVIRTPSRTLGAASALMLALAGVPAARAQTEPPTPSQPLLEEVVVTGSLIPQLRTETSTPALVIQAEDLQIKGFTTIADALQHSAMATGAVQGPQYQNGFTPGAQTLSLFGLSPSYTKFLIDGRPIADYPALYNGTDVITSIDSIPTVMIDHIDILPGGQSSIYGSDAIAGVVNITLRKKMDGPMADVRFGWTKDGGGTEKRIGLADGFSRGALNVVVGAQYQKTDPIWGFQRRLTDQYYAAGSSPQTAERDWLVFGFNGQPNGDLYYMADPALCANLTGQFDGSVGLRTRANRGQYCGTFRSGYFTINNGTEAEQGYLHAAFDVNDRVQVFTDVLLDHDVTLFNSGTAHLDTSADSSGPYYYFFDPAVAQAAGEPCIKPDGSDCDLLNVQRLFSPQEAGRLRDQDSKDTKNSIRATLGIEGHLGASDWQYQADATFTENKLTEATYLAFTTPIYGFFSSIFGPNLGPDPIFGSPTYNVNFPQFYQPLTPAQYASFTGYASSYSRTEETLWRAQLTNSSLFTMAGGKAGIAMVLEGGPQGWDYAPDPRFLNGGTYLVTSSAGSGHRSRSAATVELRMPVIKDLTVDLSDRYDDYRVSGQDVTRDTYTIGAEYRPIKSLLLRGRYGTSFKAPTLADEYQGLSGFYQTTTDYYACAKAGYTGANIGNCQYANLSYFGTTMGNPQLKPITAKNWDLGLVWTPLAGLSINADYLHWAISNEVQVQDADQILRTESACQLGQLLITSPTCVQAIAQVTRDANGLLTQFSAPKLNVHAETLGVLVLGFAYTFPTDRAGEFRFEGSYSDLFKHTLTRFPGDPVIDLLTNPFYSTDFKSKENLTVGWSLAKLGVSLYVERYGRTPNFLAQQTVAGYAAAGAGTVGTWTLANLSARYQLTPALALHGNVNNAFDTMPPPDHSWPGIYNQPYSAVNYNNYGRSYFISAEYRFGQ
jgi:iron complex outermembrane recepter protein